MRRPRIIIVSLLLIALPLGLMQALRSERLILATLHWALERFTDLRLELRNPRIDLLAGKVSADEIHLLPPGSSGTAMITVLGFSGTTSIADLLSADLADSSLSAAEFLVYVSENDESADPEPMNWLQYLTWLPRELSVDSMHVIYSARRTVVIPMLEVRGQRLGGQEYRANAKADYEGEPLLVDLLLHGVMEQERFTGLELTADLTAPESGSEITLKGHLRGTEANFQYDLALDGRYRDINEFLKAFQATGTVEGALQIQGRLQGDTERFTLYDTSLVLDNMPAYGFEAGGELEFDFDGSSTLHMVAAGEMSSLGHLLQWVDLDLSELGRAQASMEITGSLDRPYIEEFILSTRQDNGLTVNVSGSSYFPGTSSTEEPSRENRLQFDVLGPSLSVLEPWTGELDIEPGPWRASGTLTGNREAIAVNQLIAETGSEDTVTFRLEGSVLNIINVVESGLSGIEGIEGKLSASTPDTAYLGKVFRRELVSGHQLAATVEVDGSGDSMRFSHGRFDVTTEGGIARADIASALLTPLEQNKLSGVRGKLQLNLDDASIAGRYLGATELPSLGPLTATGELISRDSQLSLQDIKLSVSSALLDIDARGRIDDLLNLSGVSLKTDYRGLKVAQVLEYLFEGFSYEKPLGDLQGSFTLSDGGNDWHLSQILMQTAERGGPFELDMHGAVRSFKGIPEADFSTEYQVRNSDLLEALTNLRLKPLSSKVTVRSRPGRLTISSRSRIGKTLLTLSGVIEHENEQVQSLHLAAATPHLYLKDLGLQFEKEGGDTYRPADQLGEDEERSDLIGTLLRAPPTFPLEVKLKIDGITGDNTDIEGAEIHVVGEKGRYTLRQFTLDYADTIAELRGVVDLNPDPPAVSIGVEAVAVPVNALSQDLGMDMDISGTVTVRGGITAYGENLEAMKSTLEGTMGVALEDAIIKGGAYDILATDLLRWVISAASTRTSTHLDCTMALLDFDRGIVSTDSLFIETPEIVATGEGKLNLLKETIDLTITPMSKSRSLQVPSSVRIKGPIANPTPTISPVTAVMNVYTEALTLIPRMTLRIFGIKPDSGGKNRPCKLQ